MTSTSDPAYLSLRDVAARWGISHSSVLSLVAAGELPAVDVSTHPAARSRYLVAITDLHEFERRRRTAPPEPTPPRRRRSRAAAAPTEFF